MARAGRSGATEARPHASATRGPKATLDRLFGIDGRSLAAFRVALGGLLAADLVSRAADLETHYSDAGVLPREAFRRLFASSPWQWSIHLWTGSVGGEGVLFAAALVSAVLLVVGYRTRLATAFSWVLLLSLQARNPMILYGADQLIRLLVFWSLFLPLGAEWSIDARRLGASGRPRRFCSVATAALLLQPALMYVCSGALKHDPSWQSGQALAFALASDMFAAPLGHRLLAYPGLLARLTPVVPVFEVFAPLALFVPFATTMFRVSALVMLVGFHLTIGMLFATGLFQYAAITALLPFVPGRVWDRLTAMEVVRGVAARIAATLPRASAPRETAPLPSGLRWWLGAGSHVLVAVTFGYVVAWNVAGFGLETYARSQSLTWARQWWAAGHTGMPLLFRDDVVERRLGAFGWIGRVAGLQQRWDMFYRTSPEERGWHAVIATFGDGRTVSVLEGGRPVAPGALTKPVSTLALYPGTRWATYFAYLRTPGAEPARRLLPPVIARTWSERHPDQPIERLRIVFVQEDAPSGEGAALLRENVWYDGPPYEAASSR